MKSIGHDSVWFDVYATNSVAANVSIMVSSAGPALIAVSAVARAVTDCAIEDLAPSPTTMEDARARNPRTSPETAPHATQDRTYLQMSLRDRFRGSQYVYLVFELVGNDHLSPQTAKLAL